MFDSVLDSVISALNTEGIPAVRKFPHCILDRDSAAVAVSLKSGSISASGCGNYLGIWEAGGEVKEIYGSRGELKIGIEIFTPSTAEHGVPECSSLLGDICACIGGIAGVKLRSFEHSEPCYDSETEMFRCETVLNVTVYLVSDRDEGGGFRDFVLRGELT